MMFSNTNTFSLLAISSLLLARLGESLAIDQVQRLRMARKDLSSSVQRSEPVSRRQEGAAAGLVQPIWLSEDGLYYYTNVSLGTPPQPLTLALSMEGTTWAPTLPAGVSAEAYCEDGNNELACQYAQISGFWSVTYAPRGDFQTLSISDEGEINGIQAIEHISLGSTVLANVGLAIANSWSTPPLLSLDPAQANNPGPQLLVDREGVTDYGTGEIAFGGIDESQFFDELSSFNATNATGAGVVPVSDLYWIDADRRNVSIVDEDSSAGHLGVGQVSLTPYLWLQDAMFDIIISLFADVQKSNDTGIYSRKCSDPLSNIDIRSLQISIDGTIVTIPVEVLFVTLENSENVCDLAIRPISEYPVNTTADYILGFPFLRSAYTVLDHTNQQTHVAPRRPVFVEESTLTPVGANNDTVSGTGPILRATIEPVTTTLTAPLGAETTTSPTSSSPPSATTSHPVQTQYFYNAPSNGPNVGAIVGGVVGGVVLIAILIVIYPLKKMRDERAAARRRRAERAAERASAARLSPVDSNSNDNENDEDGEDGDKDAEAVATAIAISESKKEAARNAAGGRDSVTVNITELDSNSSSGDRNSRDHDVKSVNTFGESEKHDQPHAR
ncbi:hypothetical protein ABW19_dt0202810 [Dactylella cylindrospora]|nr:hypothetical protein ABW19_dt0202810 [Dactylella cylindrospora]